MFSNIPVELQDYSQWVCWKYGETQSGKPTKLPMQALSGWLADVTNPQHYASFAAAVALVQSGRANGIGFCFTENDPYAGIDLDKPSRPDIHEAQRRILDTMCSYTEYSPSGTGLHIIVKGSVPKGIRSNDVEIYSSGRFFAFTGNLFDGIFRPIEDRSHMLGILYAEMDTGRVKGSAGNTTIDEPQKEADEELYARLVAGVNGDKFEKLWNGEFQALLDEKGKPYRSHSEADQALMNMIARETQNRDQMRRMFTRSSLGNDPKDNYRHRWMRKDLVERLVNKALDRAAEPETVTQIQADMQRLMYNDLQRAGNALLYRMTGEITAKHRAMDEQRAREAAAAANPVLMPIPMTTQLLAPPAPAVEPVYAAPIPADGFATPSVYSKPPGLLGEIQQAIFSMAVLPVPEIALAAALGLMAGVCGRAYNVSGTGLNLNLLVLARSGCGKEAMASGIRKIVKRCNEINEGRPIDKRKMFRDPLGPGRFSSAPAIINELHRQNCFLSIFAEAGHASMLTYDPRASVVVQDRNGVLLSLYNQSGFRDAMDASRYAKKENSTGVIDSPSFSFIAESNPTTFFENVSPQAIASGLLPRCTIIDYTGERVPNNWNAHLVMPSDDICNALLHLSHTCQVQEGSGKNAMRSFINVQFSPDAEHLHQQYAKECTDAINYYNGRKNPIAELWNRSHLQSLKIAAERAVGIAAWSGDPNFVTVSADDYLWSKGITSYQNNMFKERFDRDEMGALSAHMGKRDDLAMVWTAAAELVRHFETPFFSLSKREQHFSDQRLHREYVVGLTYLRQTLGRRLLFKNVTGGADRAIDDTVRSLIETGALAPVAHGDERRKVWESRATLYIVRNIGQLRNLASHV